MNKKITCNCYHLVHVFEVIKISCWSNAKYSCSLFKQKCQSFETSCLKTRDVWGLPVYVWKGALTLIRDQFQIVLHEPLHDHRLARRCQWLIIDDRIVPNRNGNITCFVTGDIRWKFPNSIRIWSKVLNRTGVWFAESWRIKNHEGDLEYEGDGRHGQDEGDEHPLPRNPLLLFNFVDHQLFDNRAVTTRSGSFTDPL